ncbi:MAG: hypothetical protein ABI282_11590 [Candidatus Baltobacteraceae bacterium]
MPKVSMLISDEALALIDSVAANRTAFMVAAAVRAAETELRAREDDEIASWCARSVNVDSSIDSEFAHALADGLQ